MSRARTRSIPNPFSRTQKKYQRNTGHGWVPKAEQAPPIPTIAVPSPRQNEQAQQQSHAPRLQNEHDQPSTSVKEVTRPCVTTTPRLKLHPTVFDISEIPDANLRYISPDTAVEASYGPTKYPANHRMQAPNYPWQIELPSSQASNLSDGEETESPASPIISAEAPEANITPISCTDTCSVRSRNPTMPQSSVQRKDRRLTECMLVPDATPVGSEVDRAEEAKLNKSTSSSKRTSAKRVRNTRHEGVLNTMEPRFNHVELPNFSLSVRRKRTRSTEKGFLKFWKNAIRIYEAGPPGDSYRVWGEIKNHRKARKEYKRAEQQKAMEILSPPKPRTSHPHPIRQTIEVSESLVPPEKQKEKTAAAGGASRASSLSKFESEHHLDRSIRLSSVMNADGLALSKYKTHSQDDKAAKVVDKHSEAKYHGKQGASNKSAKGSLQPLTEPASKLLARAATPSGECRTNYSSSRLSPTSIELNVGASRSVQYDGNLVGFSIYNGKALPPVPRLDTAPLSWKPSVRASRTETVTRPVHYDVLEEQTTEACKRVRPTSPLSLPWRPKQVETDAGGHEKRADAPVPVPEVKKGSTPDWSSHMQGKRVHCTKQPPCFDQRQAFRHIHNKPLRAGIKALKTETKEPRSAADRTDSLKAKISKPGPMATLTKGSANIAVENGGVGGPGAMISLPFKEDGTLVQPTTRRKIVAPLPRPTRPEPQDRPNHKHVENFLGSTMPATTASSKEKTPKQTQIRLVPAQSEVTPAEEQKHHEKSGDVLDGITDLFKHKKRRSSASSFACAGIEGGEYPTIPREGEWLDKNQHFRDIDGAFASPLAAQPRAPQPENCTRIPPVPIAVRNTLEHSRLDQGYRGETTGSEVVPFPAYDDSGFNNGQHEISAPPLSSNKNTTTAAGEKRRSDREHRTTAIIGTKKGSGVSKARITDLHQQGDGVIMEYKGRSGGFGKGKGRPEIEGGWI